MNATKLFLMKKIFNLYCCNLFVNNSTVYKNIYHLNKVALIIYAYFFVSTHRFQFKTYAITLH